MDQEYSIFPERPAVYATFWERFAAVIIDTVIVSVATWAIDLVVTDPITNFILGTAAWWLYDAMMVSGPNQATIGKKALGIKVTDTRGRRLSFARATGRHFATYVSAITLLIGYLMMLWDKNKQTLHDKIADTIVVKQAPIVIP